MEISELLQLPDNLASENILNVFGNIADKLMKEFCIISGAKKYYFAELEFYYYDKIRFKEVWNEKTYPRNNRAAGELFFHYSGFDICFNSNFKDGKFGGILIRSLIDVAKTGNKYVTGPLLCLNEVLNACTKNKELPKVVQLNEEEKLYQKKNCVISDPPIPRYGITYKNKAIKDVPWCFFDKRLLDENNQKNKFENSTWDYVKKEARDSVRYYHRFDSK